MPVVREAEQVAQVGAGGLGTPALLYLAAAGVGTLGIVDNDTVDVSNLQRQVIHSDDRLGMPKVFSAKAAMEALNPFVTHRFLSAFETSGSAAPETGWAPHHLAARIDGSLVGVMPLYLKNHSQGEYVFDYGWAHAFERFGGSYYPKLQVSVPFTPATGPRLLVDPVQGRIRQGTRYPGCLSGRNRLSVRA